MIVITAHIFTNITKMKELQLVTHLLSASHIPLNNCAPAPLVFNEQLFQQRNSLQCAHLGAGSELGTNQSLTVPESGGQGLRGRAGHAVGPVLEQAVSCRVWKASPAPYGRV